MNSSVYFSAARNHIDHAKASLAAAAELRAQRGASAMALLISQTHRRCASLMMQAAERALRYEEQVIVVMGAARDFLELKLEQDALKRIAAAHDCEVLLELAITAPLAVRIIHNVTDHEVLVHL